MDRITLGEFRNWGGIPGERSGGVDSDGLGLNGKNRYRGSSDDYQPIGESIDPCHESPKEIKHGMLKLLQ